MSGVALDPSLQRSRQIQGAEFLQCKNAHRISGRILKTYMATENGPFLKMYFLSHMGICQCYDSLPEGYPLHLSSPPMIGPRAPSQHGTTVAALKHRRNAWHRSESYAQLMRALQTSLGVIVKGWMVLTDQKKSRMKIWDHGVWL